MTDGMYRALVAVDDGKVELSSSGNLLYSTRDVNPSSLSAIRRRGLIEVGPYRDRLILTLRGRRARRDPTSVA